MRQLIQWEPLLRNVALMVHQWCDPQLQGKWDQVTGQRPQFLV